MELAAFLIVESNVNGVQAIDIVPLGGCIIRSIVLAIEL